MMPFNRLIDTLFPPKCVLCQNILSHNETDLCHTCRTEIEDYPKTKHKISYIAGWTAMWYYNEKVRRSMLLYKFYGKRNYGAIYGRLLAMRLSSKPICNYDILTWVPVSSIRKWKRGYDQVELIAKSVGQELGTPAMPILKKIRHTKPQSRLSDHSHRKANILGAYTVREPAAIKGKSILLLDDIITTGSTVSECARTLLTFGAKEVYCAAIAANKNKR